MKVLLLGSGGREHALAWKIASSYHCEQLFIAPGNPGTASLGTNVPIGITDFPQQKAFCLSEKIDMVVCGPEVPLVEGLTDFYKKDPDLSGIVVVGPSAAGAQLEGSKDFSKRFMKRHKIPSAAYESFSSDQLEEAKLFIRTHTLPIVLKADGLAAGKGVVITSDADEAISELEKMLSGEAFGDAGRRVVIEEFLDGIEVSVFVLTDGLHYKIIGHAKDYKRVGEGNVGLNTGGMGSITPVTFVDDAFMAKVESDIIRPTVEGIHAEALDYHGFIFFGLINVKGQPYLIEYNCRMGDPETQVVMPRLQTDILGLFAAMDNGTLQDANISYNDGYFASVVAVSGGYPLHYQTGKEILGLHSVSASENGIVFHAGTVIDKEGKVFTDGGRVLCTVSGADNLEQAVKSSMELMANIHFDGMYYRRDIGFEFMD